MRTGAVYFEGSPCARGHTLRYVSTRNCAQCNRAKSAAASAQARDCRVVKLVKPLAAGYVPEAPELGCKDPGTRVSLETIDAVLTRIFIDHSKRIASPRPRPVPHQFPIVDSRR